MCYAQYVYDSSISCRIIFTKATVHFPAILCTRSVSETLSNRGRGPPPPLEAWYRWGWRREGKKPCGLFWHFSVLIRVHRRYRSCAVRVHTCILYSNWHGRCCSVGAWVSPSKLTGTTRCLCPRVEYYNVFVTTTTTTTATASKAAARNMLQHFQRVKRDAFVTSTKKIRISWRCLVGEK